ncbi:MAG: hypothetical protein ACR2LT_09350, partial [Pyrinomonadaceae bacterium]
PLVDSYNISALTFNDLDLFVKRRYIDESVRQKLSELIELRAQFAQIDAKLETLDAEEKSISEDQSRLRENIEALSKTPEAKQLIARYIAKADTQESRIEAISKEKQSLKTERETIEQKLAAEIKNFELK